MGLWLGRLGCAGIEAMTSVFASAVHLGSTTGCCEHIAPINTHVGGHDMVAINSIDGILISGVIVHTGHREGRADAQWGFGWGVGCGLECGFGCGLWCGFGCGFGWGLAFSSLRRAVVTRSSSSLRAS